jgi:hypothetical protein
VPIHAFDYYLIEFLSQPAQREAAVNYSYFTATYRSDRKQLDTSQLLSQVLNLRDTDREYRAKVCVLAPQLIELYPF